MKPKVLNPFKCIAHPFTMFYDMRFKGGVSRVYPVMIIFVWLLISIMSRQNTAFLFNSNKAGDLNIFIMLARTIVLFIFWVAGNWTVSVFAGGIGRFWEIVNVSSYALIPYLGSLMILLILSHAFSLNESGFLGYISFAGLLWSGALMLIGLRQIHDLELFQTFVHMILTVVCIAVMIFLCVLFYTLLQQLFIFFITIWKEIMFRL